MDRDTIFNLIWKLQDDAYDLMAEYDSLPHRYGKEVLYQAEAYIINWIGRKPDITTTELSEVLNKTASACSQIVKKLVEKNLVVQTRNQQNKRQYNLRLTCDGEDVYRGHIAFNEYCQSVLFGMLEEFSNEELETYLRIQDRINKAYEGDVQRSKEQFA